MRRFFIAWVALCAAILLAAQVSPSRSQLTSMGVGGGFGNSGGGGGCSQATTFVARSGISSLDTAHKNAYTAFICSLVTAGLITGDLSTTGCGAPFDAIWLFATTNTTAANINICGTAFTASGVGSPTFTPETGYSSPGGAVYVDSTFNPTTATSPNFLRNSAHTSVWSNTAGVVITSAMGGCDGGFTICSQIIPRFTGDVIFARQNDASSTSASNASGLGHFISNRSGPSAQECYKNAVSLGCSQVASTGINNLSFAIVGANNGGTGAGWVGQLSAASVGGSLGSSAALTFCHALNAYLTTIAVIGGVC